MDKSLVSHSKFLSLVLRHAPEKIGIELDEAGWTSIDALIAAANAAGKRLDYDLVIRVVDENDKQRFAISPDGRKIRANQGHSVEVELQLKPAIPPEFLFHGTVEKFLTSIRQQGLIPGSRNHVHLSSDRGTALAVGRRRGRPIVLTIQSQKMHIEGSEFFISANGVWLTDQVPPKHVLFDQ